MKSFSHKKVRSIQEAASLLAQKDRKAKLIAGGSDLLHLMKERIITPEFLIPLRTIPGTASVTEDAHGVKIGAMSTLKDLETHPLIRKKFPLLAQAAAEVASPQIRNVGTLGGNLCQSPWCWYFRNPLIQCLRKGGGICFASFGENKYHAILDGGPCYMVHPSDMALPLLALGAKVKIEGHQKKGRIIPLEEFFLKPSQSIAKENVLGPEEIVTEILIPNTQAGAKGVYLKERERRAWDHAIVGIAAIVAMEGGICRYARIVLSGVAPAPFRAVASEEILKGENITEGLCLQAAEAAVSSAKPLNHNRYKVHLAKALIKRAVLATLG